MKLIGVDVDALAKRLSELRQEQSDIEAILRIAKSGSPLLAEAIPKRYGEGHNPPAKVPKPGRSYGFHQGARKAVLLALAIGPATEHVIATRLVWDESRVYPVVGPMIKVGLVCHAGSEQYALTEKGEEAAKWFTANPRFTMYNPKRTE